MRSQHAQIAILRTDTIPALHRTLDHLAKLLGDSTANHQRALDKLENARCQVQAIERGLTGLQSAGETA